MKIKNKKQFNSEYDPNLNQKENYKNPNKNRERQYGESLEHKKEKYIIICSIIGILITAIFLTIMLDKGFLILIIMLIIVICSLPMLFLVIKIPYSTVLSVELTEDNMIDLLSIDHIPLHLLPEYDITGNMPPLRTMDGSMIFIADKFDKENKIIHQCFDERYTNLRFLVYKQTFLEVKKMLKWYAQKNLRRIFIEDITVNAMVEHYLTEYNNALFKQPEKYFRQGTLVQDKQKDILNDENSLIESKILDKLQKLDKNRFNDNEDNEDNEDDKKEGKYNER